MTQTDAAEMAALRQRFGKPAPSAAAFTAASILGTNGYLLYLVLSGASSPTALALFGVLELILYSLISNAAMLAVPKQDRVGSPDVSLLAKLAAFVAVSLLLGGIAWIGVANDKVHLEMLRMRDPLATLNALNVLWPLALAAALALVGAIADWLRWRARGGGPFVNGLALMSASKFVTALLAPIVALLISEQFAGGAARALTAWCVVYLAIKTSFELLLLYWQFLGMPDRPRA